MQFESALAYKMPIPSLDDALSNWRPNIRFEIKQGRYVIKTADCLSEFEGTIRLRSEVFLREFAGKSDQTALDIETRDQKADFLIIKDSQSGEIFATYRLICSRFSEDFYSNSEFNIRNFLKSPGHKLELSRACIRADKRSSGIFLHMLWKGLIRYIEASGARYLFGCSSVQSLRLPELVDLYRSLRESNAFSETFDIQPHTDYRIVDINGMLRFGGSGPATTAVELPPLLMGYIKAGAKVHGAPAYDQDFNCLDLFTVLDFEAEPSAFLAKYLESM